MSSADGWLVEGESPKQVTRVMPRKTATQDGRGPGLYPESRDRASYGPASSLGRFPRGRRLRNSETSPKTAPGTWEQAGATKRIKDYTGA